MQGIGVQVGQSEWDFEIMKCFAFARRDPNLNLAIHMRPCGAYDLSICPCEYLDLYFGFLLWFRQVRLLGA
jgi:hypothetical protein